MLLTKRKTLPAAVLLAFSTGAFAQSQEIEISPVLVTANRVARTADETLAAVTVITRKDIAQQQARSLPELLGGLPSVQFANNGGPGKATSLFLRGSNSDQTLVLIDGVKVGSATTGAASLQDIPLDIIERIEIVRGPRASLYGSEAIGGVIQIFTRKGAQRPSFSFGGGSNSTYESSAAGGFGSAEAWLNVGASGFMTTGINARNGSTESDRDGYTRSTVNLRGGGRLSDALSADGQLQHTQGRNEYDGNPNITRLQQDLYAANLRYAPGEKFTTSLRLAEALDAGENFKEDKFSSRFDTRRQTASWQNELSLLKGHQLVSGLDYQYDEVMSSAAYDRNKRRNHAAFAQYLAKLGKFDFQFAGRRDLNEQFGGHNTGSVAAGYSFSPALRLNASVGRAFKAPTFNALYYPYSGNPDLAPEKSRNKEIGVSGSASALSWQLSAFDSHISNMVEWIETPPGTWNPYNTSVRIRGAELSAKLKLNKTTLGGSYTQLLPVYDIDSVRGNLLARRARQSGKLDIDQQLGTWSVGASMLATGKRYNDAGNFVKLGGYATFDVRAEYALNPEWRVQTRLENVFDKRYETAYSYNQPGFGAFVTLRYQPQ